jgi:hypothetical protein
VFASVRHVGNPSAEQFADLLDREVRDFGASVVRGGDENADVLTILKGKLGKGKPALMHDGVVDLVHGMILHDAPVVGRSKWGYP